MTKWFPTLSSYSNIRAYSNYWLIDSVITQFNVLLPTVKIYIQSSLSYRFILLLKFTWLQVILQIVDSFSVNIIQVCVCTQSITICNYKGIAHLLSPTVQYRFIYNDLSKIRFILCIQLDNHNDISTAHLHVYSIIIQVDLGRRKMVLTSLQ